MMVVMLRALVVVVAALGMTAASAAAQTKSPTRKPTAPTPAPPPLCGVYGQLPQLINGSNVQNALHGMNVALSADASVLAVAAPMEGFGKIRVYARPVGAPTATLFALASVLEPPAAWDVKLFLDNTFSPMGMSATGDTIAVGTTRRGDDANSSVVIFRATQRAFVNNAFNVSIFLAEGLGLTPASNGFVNFGAAVSVSPSGDTIAVGAPFECGAGPNTRVGAVAVFRRGANANTPSFRFGLETVLRPSVGTATNVYFGWAVAATDVDALAVGAPGFSAGIVYPFSRSLDGVWSQQGPVLTPVSATAAGAFGAALSIDRSGVTLMVGDPRDDAGGSTEEGAVWFSARASRTSTWGIPQRVAPRKPITSASFGMSVALSDAGVVAVTGAPQTDSSLGAAPALYRLDLNASNGIWFISNAYSTPNRASQTPSYSPSASTLLGVSVDMSGDGSVIVAGSPQRLNVADVEVGAAEVWACGLPL